jgi:hypothetical protein
VDLLELRGRQHVDRKDLVRDRAVRPDSSAEAAWKSALKRRSSL